MKLASKSIDRL